jgi:hypothetical protein
MAVRRGPSVAAYRAEDTLRNSQGFVEVLSIPRVQVNKFPSSVFAIHYNFV